MRHIPILLAFLLLTPQAAWGQLLIQSNPVFSTPVPEEQKLGPVERPFQGEILEAGPLDMIPDVQIPDIPELPPDALTPPLETEEAGTITLDEVHYSGNRYTRHWMVRRYLKPLTEAPDGPIHPDTLKARLQTINRFAPFQVQGRLIQDEESGQTRLELDVYEQQPWQIVGTFDNQGRPGIGYYRGGAQLINHNLLGFGDRLGVGYVGSEGAQRLTVDYKIPLNTRGGELGVQYIFHDLDYARNLLPPGVYDLDGQDNALILTLSQPIDKQRRLTPYLSTLFREVTITRNGVEILSANPRPWTLGLRYNDTDRYGRTSLDLQPVIVGQHWFGGDSKFYRARATLFRSLQLPKDNLLVFRGAWQVSGDELPPVQALQVGGEYSVRGYTEGLLTGDRGHYYQLEHHWPVPFLKRANPWLAERLRGITFFDFGQAWIDKSNPRYISGVSAQFGRTTLASVGIGARYRLTQYLQGFVDAGWGLFNRNAIELNADPTVRMHFGIRSDLLPRPFRTRPNMPRRQ